MSGLDSPPSTTAREVSSAAILATTTVFTSFNSSSINTSATPVSLSECVQRCVINVATGGPYGTCTDQLQDMSCICNDQRFQAATGGCIANVCPLYTEPAIHFASQFCAGVLAPATGSPTANANLNATTSEPGLSAAAVAGIGVGSALGGMLILAAIVVLMSHGVRRRIKRHQGFLPPSMRQAHHAELPAYQGNAQADGVSPVSPQSTHGGKSPIDTVLSRQEQDELHALRAQVQSMRAQMLESREKVELDGGIGGLREMAA